MQLRGIDTLGDEPKGSVVDLIGVVEHIDDTQIFTNRKSGEETDRRVLSLRDRSDMCIDLTLWGSMTQDPGDKIAQVWTMVCVLQARGSATDFVQCPVLWRSSHKIWCRFVQSKND